MASKKKKAKPKKVPSARKAPARKVQTKRAAKAKAKAKAPRARTLAHPVFGGVKVDPGAGVYWQKVLRLADHDVSVDMTIEEPAEATPDLLDRAAQLVARLSHFDALARAGLRRSYDEDADSAVTRYATHHLEELSAGTLKRIFDKPKAAIAIEDVLTRLLLKRVGSYPRNGGGGTATFDYTIDGDETQYILTVQLDESGEVIGVEMES